MDSSYTHVIICKPQILWFIVRGEIFYGRLTHAAPSFFDVSLNKPLPSENIETNGWLAEMSSRLLLTEKSSRLLLTENTALTREVLWIVVVN